MSQGRANLIFLVVLLALMVPGAVLMFKKKLDPNARRMFMPDAVRHRLPYMAPFGSAETVRYVPPVTEQWLNALAVQRTGQPMMLIGGLPPMSPDWAVQAVAIQASPGGAQVAVLFWEPIEAAELSSGKIGLIAGSKTIPGRLVRTTPIPMPREVRDELMRGGYPRPPAELTWVLLSFEEVPAPGAELLITRPAGRGHRVRVLR